MRLIDVDYLKKNGYRICRVGNGVFGLGDVTNEIPTAYDIDKVIEELKQRALPVLDEDDIESTFEAIMLEDSIEIVKNGLDKME